MPALCGLILAAGASRRMGTDKALLPWPPERSDGSILTRRLPSTLLSAQIAALRPFTETVIVVAGKNAERLKPVAEACGAALVVNPEPGRGQFSSLQTGLRAVLERGFEAAMISPVDSPPLGAASLTRLRDGFELALARGKWAVTPENQGRHGHPLLAGRALMDALLGAPVTSNAREVKHAHAEFFEDVTVPDLHASAEMNTPEEYEALAAKNQPRPSS
jgi:molybdenum cofactor cytidylyltransferase